MSSEGVLLVVAGTVVLVLLALVALAVRSAARTRRDLQDLAARVEELEHERRAEVREGHGVEATAIIEGRVTDDERPRQPLPAVEGTIDGRIDGRLFADLVARETTIKAAGLVHGVRRALAPETRNRIRFEVRREVKRSRRQRRSDLKAALREQQARERRGTAGREDDEDAA